jgi:hypothetical protein
VADRQWPCEPQDILDKDSYPYPYYIDSQIPTFSWTNKTEQEIEETFDDPMNVKFKIDNEFNVKI